MTPGSGSDPGFGVDLPTSSVRGRSVGTVLPVVVGPVLVGLAALAVGPERLLGALSRADPGTVAAVAGLSLAALGLRGLVLWTTLRAVGAPVGVARALVTYLAVSFLTAVVPGGGAGATPVAGSVVARSAAADYETGVAATLTVTALSNLMVGLFGAVGVVLLLSTGAGDAATTAAGAVGVGLFVVAALAAIALWRTRERVGGTAVSGVGRLLAIVDRRLPDRWSVPGPDRVAARARTFGAAADRVVGGSRAQSAALLGLSAAAHVASVLALLAAFGALDGSVSVGVLFAVIPTAVLGAVAPTPGAAGGVEVALGSLLSVATGEPAAVVGAAVLIYRGSGYAFRLVFGGLAAVVLVALR